MLQAALLLGPYDLANPKPLEVLVMGKCAVWRRDETTVEASQHRPLGFWSKTMPPATETPAAETYTLWKRVPGVLRETSRDRTLDCKTPSNHASGTVHYELGSVGPTES